MTQRLLLEVNDVRLLLLHYGFHYVHDAFLDPEVSLHISKHSDGNTPHMGCPHLNSESFRQHESQDMLTRASVVYRQVSSKPEGQLLFPENLQKQG